MITASQLQTAARLAEIRDAHPLMMFQPSPALSAFCEDFSSRFQCVRAANRVGKTRHATYKAARFLVENPGARARFVGPTRRQVSEVVGRYLSEFLSPYLHRSSYYTPGRGWNQPSIRLKSGSICQMKSYEDHPNSHAGDELDLICLDEPPPSAIFMESLARTMSRSGPPHNAGYVWLTLTPVGRPVDWLREVVEASGSPWTQYVAEFSAENCPWYSPEQVSEWLEVMSASAWEAEQRLRGAWDGVTVERFLSGFSEANVDAAAIGPGTDVEVAIAMDHGEIGGNTVAVLLVWGGGKSRSAPSWAPQAGRSVWILDEHVSEAGDSEVEHAAGLLDMLQRNGFRPGDVRIAVGDTNRRGNWRINDLIGTEIARQTKRSSAPFRLQNATKARDWGFRVLNSSFKRRELFIHPRAESVIKSCRHWKGGKTGSDGELSHAADALRYGVLSILGDRPFYSGLQFR